MLFQLSRTFDFKEARITVGDSFEESMQNAYTVQFAAYWQDLKSCFHAAEPTPR